MYLKVQCILGYNVPLAIFAPHYAATSKIGILEDFRRKRSLTTLLRDEIKPISDVISRDSAMTRKPACHGSPLGIASCDFVRTIPAGADIVRQSLTCLLWQG
jgi:hypothetical protein